jgi:chaperonin GroES
MQLKPLKDNIIVRPDPPPAMIGAIHVPENVPDENPNYLTMTGTVLAIGPGGYSTMHEHQETRQTIWEGHRTPMTVKVGERVCYNRYAGRQLKHDGEMLLVMHESEVMGIVPEGVGVGLPGYQEATDSGVRDLPRDWAETYERTGSMS